MKKTGPFRKQCFYPHFSLIDDNISSTDCPAILLPVIKPNLDRRDVSKSHGDATLAIMMKTETTYENRSAIAQKLTKVMLNLEPFVDGQSGK